MIRITGLGSWFVDRLGLARIRDFALRHPVPRGHGERAGWMYVLGIATLVAFLLQVVTGIALATKYIPSAAHAYASLRYINAEVWLGALLRAMHYFGATAMIVLILAHMTRVFLTGSYKYPREMTWIFGVVLLLLTGLMAATGQLLRWDQDGLWTVAVGSQLLGRVPLVGEQFARFVLAGDSVGGATLSRFFVFHVLILPGLIIGAVAMHLYLVLHHGISEPPKAGRRVDPATYRSEYQRELDDSPYIYWPDAAWREAAAGLLVVIVVIGLAIAFGPKGPGLPPDPTAIPADPRPDWYFRWYYALLWVKPRGLETEVMVYLPLGIGIALMLLPLLSGKGERSPRMRTWAIMVVVALLTTLGVLTELGLRAPWAMDFETRPLAAQAVGIGEGEVWTGSQLFYERGCQYCHSALGEGGRYGPEAERMGQRLPPELITARTIMGFGNMPAYRDVLSPQELAAIVAFIQSTARHER